MTTRAEIAHQVSTTLGDHAADFDIDAITEEITERYGLVDIDAIDSEEYNALIERHDTTA
ncbi:hypothetical protein G3I39_29830 [Streptomyces fulvissimus]|uniref:Uncharacterized protein n=1 Tax=Streptomyces microflavus TaxID=1919 RepID=A0A6N9VED7_STRMI|nr:hypothetical protein [Streptomyces microflavus]NEB71234.1 hypothetical protein [Streptomyces microflavus]